MQGHNESGESSIENSPKHFDSVPVRISLCLEFSSHLCLMYRKKLSQLPLKNLSKSKKNPSVKKPLNLSPNSISHQPLLLQILKQILPWFSAFLLHYPLIHFFRRKSMKFSSAPKMKTSLYFYSFMSTFLISHRFFNLKQLQSKFLAFQNS